MKDSNRGGNRKGSGRPPMSSDGKVLVKRTYTLSAHHHELAKRFGHSNASQGVRAGLEELERKERRAKKRAKNV